MLIFFNDDEGQYTQHELKCNHTEYGCVILYCLTSLLDTIKNELFNIWVCQLNLPS